MWFFRKKQAPPIEESVPKKQPEMTAQEKELLLVQKTTISDMEELTSMPFVWNTDVQKFIAPNAHPFAYIDIIGENIQIAKAELEKINSQIAHDSKIYPNIPRNARIPVKDIVFKKSEMYGYTRIMCTPKTLSGKIAKYPIKLFFATDLSKTATGGNTTHGELVYNKDGEVVSATIYCWRRSGGFFFYYKAVDGVLTLQKTESKNIPR